MGKLEWIKQLWEPGNRLSQRVTRSGIWLLATRLSARSIWFIRTIILARLLAPEDFGIMGIALVAISAFQVFTQTGFQTALIQKKERADEYLDTAWIVSVLRGAILSLILFLAAPYVAIFFNQEGTELVLKVLILTVFISNTANIGIIHFRRNLEFRKQFIYEISGALSNFLVSVPFALIWRSVWALVAGSLAESFVMFFVSYLTQPFRPRLRFEFSKAKELFQFGKWILAMAIIEFISLQGDNAFVGKLLGATALGYYEMAFRFGNMPLQEIGSIARIAFPAYSRLQDNRLKLKDAYIRVLRFNTFFTAPIAGGLYILAPEFTIVFLGNKWAPIIPALQILSISAIVRIIGGSVGPLFNSIGKPSLTFKMDFARFLILLVSIYPLTSRLGIQGTALSVLLAVSTYLPFWLWGCRRELNLEINSLFRNTGIPLLGTVIMVGLISLVKGYLPSPHLIFRLVFLSIIGTIVFLGYTAISIRFMRYEIIRDFHFLRTSI